MPNCFTHSDFLLLLLLKVSFSANFAEIIGMLITKIINKVQLCRLMYCSLLVQHVSSDIFAHDQEHVDCIYI
jgi:hypothetical protein